MTKRFNQEVERWPDGTVKSAHTGFTVGFSAEGIPHGYKPDSTVKPTRRKAKRGPRSPGAFGVLDGTISGLKK